MDVKIDDYGLIEWDKKTVVATAVIEIPLTASDISHIISGCFDGGISRNWMGLNNRKPEWDDKPKGVPLSEWATKILLEGKTVCFYDVEEEDGEEDKWQLTLDKLIKGFAQNAKERPENSNKENFDAIDYDCVIQYALFGELIYG